MVHQTTGTPHATQMTRRRFVGATAIAATAAGLITRPSFAQESTPATASPAVGGTLTMYCGRSENLVSPLIPQIENATGITLEVRYGNTAELAAQILEEGDNTPAGLFFAQDAGSLGALAKEGMLAELPDDILDAVESRFRSDDGLWVGISGRARVLVYNPEVTDPATLPAMILDLPKTELSGPIGWAPTNASFQSFITAMRLVHGEETTRQWLEAMIATGPVTFDGNAPQVEAAANQEISVGLVNHYYLYQARKENPEIAAENYFFPNGDIGSLINVAGVGMIGGTDQTEQALAVTRYLLTEDAQTYFAQETSEYPLAAGVEPIADLPPLAEIETPDIDLSDLDDLQGTLQLLTELGLI